MIRDEMKQEVHHLLGTVMKGIGGFYYVRDEAGQEHQLRAQNKIRRVKLRPCVGDRVEFTPGEGEADGWVSAILPRANALVRPPVANIDVIVLTVASAAPDPDLMLIDQMLLVARQAGIPVELAITKADRDPAMAEAIRRQYEPAGLNPVCVCALDGTGLPELRERLKGRIHALAGQSGAGKSTLINALHGLHLETGGLSEKIERGKNTTRRCELIPVEGGGMVLDTPGFSLLELELTEPEKLQEWMPEFEPYAGRCRFTPCMHMSEPDCAVKQALADGAFSRERYERYCEIAREMKQRWRNRYD